MAAGGRVQVELGGVPETMLWTLWQRAVEAGRPDAVLDDPPAVELVRRLDYPFAARFGSAFGQWQALRARCFDEEIRRFERAAPGGTVVALGEGLETQFWRVDDGRVQWVTVEVPEAVALRRELLPASGRRREISGSALEPAWMDEVDPAGPVLITAQGLLMYAEPDAVHGLVAALAGRFPGAALVFDAVPAWLAARSRASGLTTGGGYTPPPWHWGLDAAEERRLRAIPGVDALDALRPPRGRGLVHGAFLPLAARVPALRRLGLSVLRARFVAR